MSAQVRGLCAWGCGRLVWERPGYSAHLNLAPNCWTLVPSPLLASHQVFYQLRTSFLHTWAL